MATLDVAWVCECGEFVNQFEVVRRQEHVSQFGRAEVIAEPTQFALGTIFPTGDNSLQRQADFETSSKTMTIITRYPLRTSSPGYQPDIVLYQGNTYIVQSVKDWMQIGSGFVEAEVTSLDAQPSPPH